MLMDDYLFLLFIPVDVVPGVVLEDVVVVAFLFATFLLLLSCLHTLDMIENIDFCLSKEVSRVCSW